MDRARVHAALDMVFAAPGGAGGGPPSYDQEHLPPGVTRDAFLRRHRDRVGRAVEGWTRAGVGRVVPRTAWDLDGDAATTRPRARRPTTMVAEPADLDARLDAALGIVTTRGAR